MSRILDSQFSFALELSSLAEYSDMTHEGKCEVPDRLVLGNRAKLEMFGPSARLVESTLFKRRKRTQEGAQYATRSVKYGSHPRVRRQPGIAEKIQAPLNPSDKSSFKDSD